MGGLGLVNVAVKGVMKGSLETRVGCLLQFNS